MPECHLFDGLGVTGSSDIAEMKSILLRLRHLDETGVGVVAHSGEAATARSPDSRWEATNIGLTSPAQRGAAIFLLSLAERQQIQIFWRRLAWAACRNVLIQITQYLQGEDVLRVTSSNFLFRRDRVRPLKNY